MRYRHICWIKVDHYKRFAFFKYEFKKNFLKSIKNNNNASYYVRYRAVWHFCHYPKMSTKAYSVNRCVIRGKSYSVDKRIHTDRFIFRTEAYSSNLPGCSRASW